LDLIGVVGNSVGDMDLVSGNSNMSGTGSYKASNVNLESGLGYNGTTSGSFTYYAGAQIQVQGGNAITNSLGGNIILTTGNQAGSTLGSKMPGNVGININNPTNSLDVNGNISCSVITASLFYGTASYSTPPSSSVFIIHADGTSTTYTPISNTNTSRGNILLSASLSAINSDTIYLSENTYDIGFNQIDLSLGGTGTLNLQGRGKLNTTIISSWFGYMVVPGINSEISSLTLQTTNHSYPSPCIGSNSGTISGSTIRNVKLIGQTDGIYYNNGCTVLGTVNVYDTDIYTNWDTIVWTPATGQGTINIYNSNCFVVPTGSVTVTQPSDGFVAESGNTANLFNCSFNISGSGSSATSNGIYIDAVYGGPIVNVYGCVINTNAPTSSYDFSHLQAFGSKLYTTANTIYNPLKISGPILYSDTQQILKSINSSVTSSISSSFASASISSSQSISSSYALTSSYALNAVPTVSSSFASSSISSSFTFTSSYIRLFNGTTNSWYTLQMSGSAGQETLILLPTN